MSEKSPPPRLLHLVVPAAIVAGIVVALWFAGRFGRVTFAAGISFVSLGKLIILSGSVGTFRMGPWELALMVFTMDFLYAYLLAFNLEWLFRVRGFGPWLERLVNYCRYWLVQHPWMRRFAFAGVMLFVMFPLTGTGAPGGSILGRLVGLGRRITLLAITLGSALGCVILASSAAQLAPLMEGVREEPWFRACGLVILAIVVLVLLWLGRKVSRAADEYARSRASGG